MSKINKKGRSNKSQYVALAHSVFYSAAYRALSPTARALLFEVIGIHNGVNNGEIFLGVRDAERLLGVFGDRAVSAAFEELCENGLLKLFERGHFSLKGSRATRWGLTWVPVGNAPPSREFAKWFAEPGSKAAKRLIALQNCFLRPAFRTIADCIKRPQPEDVAHLPSSTVVDLQTASSQNARKTDIYQIGSTTTQIIYHPRQRASVGDCDRLRFQILRWLEQPDLNRNQRYLARTAVINESTLSRFLSNKGRKRTLKVQDLTALRRAISASPVKKVVTL